MGYPVSGRELGNGDKRQQINTSRTGDKFHAVDAATKIICSLSASFCRIDRSSETIAAAAAAAAAIILNDFAPTTDIDVSTEHLMI